MPETDELDVDIDAALRQPYSFAGLILEGTDERLAHRGYPRGHGARRSALRKKLGYTIKLLATIRLIAGGSGGAGASTWSLTHVLASVSGCLQCGLGGSDVVGSTLFYGRGAGPDATASAVLRRHRQAAMTVTGWDSVVWLRTPATPACLPER
jgi:homoserine dehydrogenase